MFTIPHVLMFFFLLLLIFYLFLTLRLTRSTLCPYTTLFRSRTRARRHPGRGARCAPPPHPGAARRLCLRVGGRPLGDRKSTRLNSSHLGRSYDVFCLKKKKVITIWTRMRFSRGSLSTHSV